MNSSKQNSSNLSREKIQHYHSTKDESVKHEIEKEALESDFDTDALEGWDSLALSGFSMRKLNSKYSRRFSPKIVGIALIVPLALVTIYLLNQGKETSNQKSTSKLTETNSIKVEETDLVIPAHIEALVELPKKEQIVAQTIIKDFNVQKNDKNESSESSNPIEVNHLPISKLDNEEIKSAGLVKESLIGKEIYLYDMKLLDYRAYRSKPKITSKQMILTGTPANIGESSNVEETTEWKNVDIPYIEYLDKTMELFSKGNNKKALTRFQLILETYPDDINANFYAGLCFYNLKAYDSAASCFSKCVDSKYINFLEEAEWYQAKSLLGDGKKTEANNLFTEIIKRNGYYAKQAEKIINGN